MEAKNPEPLKEPKPEFKYPPKPKRDSAKDSIWRKTHVLCNLKQINLGEEKKQVQQYAIHYEPIIADDNYPLKRKIIRQIRKDLNGYFEKFAQAGDTIFVFSKDPQEKVSIETTIDNNLYKVTFFRT